MESEKHPMTVALNDLGLFVRFYEPGVAESFNDVAQELHTQLCALDTGNLAPWLDLKLCDFVNAWVGTRRGYRKLE